MHVRHFILLSLFTIGLISCKEENESSKQESTEIVDDSEKEVEAQTTKGEVVEVISFNNDSKFTISKKNAGTNEATGTESFDLFLNNELLDAPIKLGNELAMNYVKAGDAGIPKSTVFAFSTWFSGGGETYYGVVKKGILRIFRKFEDEGMTDPGQYELFREIDPNVSTETPAYFIQYAPDDKRGSDLMIAFTEDGTALYAKYDGLVRHTSLKLLEDQSEGRNIIKTYSELVKGKINGSFKLTHSGNWDYAEYVYIGSDKTYNYTINHDATIVNDTYRTTPSF